MAGVREGSYRDGNGRGRYEDMWGLPHGVPVRWLLSAAIRRQMLSIYHLYNLDPLPLPAVIRCCGDSAPPP